MIHTTKIEFDINSFENKKGNNLHCIRGALNSFAGLKKLAYGENPRLTEKTGRSKCKKSKCAEDIEIFNAFPVTECNFYDYSQAINSGGS